MNSPLALPAERSAPRRAARCSAQAGTWRALLPLPVRASTQLAWLYLRRTTTGWRSFVHARSPSSQLLHPRRGPQARATAFSSQVRWPAVASPSSKLRRARAAAREPQGHDTWLIQMRSRVLQRMCRAILTGRPCTVHQENRSQRRCRTTVPTCARRYRRVACALCASAGTTRLWTGAPYACACCARCGSASAPFRARALASTGGALEMAGDWARCVPREAS